MNLGEALLNIRPKRVRRREPQKLPRVDHKTVSYERKTPSLDRVVAALTERSSARNIATALNIEITVAFMYLLRAEKAGRAQRWKEGRLTYWKANK